MSHRVCGDCLRSSTPHDRGIGHDGAQRLTQVFLLLQRRREEERQKQAMAEREAQRLREEEETRRRQAEEDAKRQEAVKLAEEQLAKYALLVGLRARTLRRSVPMAGHAFVTVLIRSVAAQAA